VSSYMDANEALSELSDKFGKVRTELQDSFNGLDRFVALLNDRFVAPLNEEPNSEDDDEIFQGVVFAGQTGIFDRDEDARMGVCYHLDDGRFLNIEMTPTKLRMFISVNLVSQGDAIAKSPEAWWDAIYKGDV